MSQVQVSRNASSDLGLMDIVLSRPSPIRWSLSKAAHVVEGIIHNLQNLQLRLEPRNIHVNERIIEIPFVLQHLPKTGRILDIGSASSLMALQLATMGYDVTAIDIRPYPFHHKNLTFLQQDISHLTLEKDSHDCAVVISTIEHVGLGSYGDDRTLSDRDFLDTIAKYVRPNGSIILTMPFGKAYQTNWYRVYDSQALYRLIEGYAPLETKFSRRVSAYEWQICDETDLALISSENQPMNGVALVCISVPG
jgi:hypothetical protein